MPYGTLELQVLEGRHLKDTDILGKSDPYCVIRAGTQQFRTRTIQGGGKNPLWNEKFTFNISNDVTSVLMTVWDEDPGRDDEIGEASFDLGQAFATGILDAWVGIRRKHSNKSAGEVHVVGCFRPTGGVVSAVPIQQHQVVVPGVAPAATAYGHQMQPQVMYAQQPQQVMMQPQTVYTQPYGAPYAAATQGVIYGANLGNGMAYPQQQMYGGAPYAAAAPSPYGQAPGMYGQPPMMTQQSPYGAPYNAQPPYPAAPGYRPPY